MAYVPDKIGERRRAEGVTATACEFFVKYCEFADQETALTFATPKTIAKAFGMRIDNAQKYDLELQDKDWIEVVIVNGRTCRRMKAGWLSRNERRRRQDLEIKIKQFIVTFKKEFNELLNLRDSSYILGELPKFKENLLNFRNTYKEFFDQPLNQQLDQLFDQIETASVRVMSAAMTKNADNFPDDRDGKPGSIPGGNVYRNDADQSPLIALPESFVITFAMREWARTFAPNIDLDAQTVEFKNYWIHQATRYKYKRERAWLATWENRMIALQREEKIRLERDQNWKDANPPKKSPVEFEREKQAQLANVGRSQPVETVISSEPIKLDAYGLMEALDGLKEIQTDGLEIEDFEKYYVAEDWNYLKSELEKSLALVE